MQKLSHRVNVIPVIGRADSFTVSELKGFKKRVSLLHFAVLHWNSALTCIYLDYGGYRALRYPRVQLSLRRRGR